MPTSKWSPPTYVTFLLIILAASSRLFPHWMNFTPIGALAMFGGAYFNRKSLAIAVPFLALWLSDLFVMNVMYASYYPEFTFFGEPTVYLGILLTVLLSRFLLKRITLRRFLGAGFGGALLFFLVTNFGSWLSLPMYSKDLSGLLSAYVAGIPFIRNTIAGNLVYGGVLFGLYEIYRWYKFQKLSPVRSKTPMLSPLMGQ